MPVKFTITRSQTVKSPRLDRAGLDDTWILYTTADGKPGSVVVAGSPPTDEEIIAAVNAEEAKHDAMQGRVLGG